MQLETRHIKTPCIGLQENCSSLSNIAQFQVKSSINSPELGPGLITPKYISLYAQNDHIRGVLYTGVIIAIESWRL